MRLSQRLSACPMPEHRLRDYAIAAFTFFCVGVCLVIDGDAPMERQNALGVCAWVFLICMVMWEERDVKMQVLVAIAFATIGEHFASPFMGGYTYRFENVPAYVPPGHGMVYLTAVALGRSAFFHRHWKSIVATVLLTGFGWSVWGITQAGRGDAVGALLFCVFAVFVIWGRSPLLYLAAFFITTYLELIGTAVGTWHWAVIDPVLSLPQGNPPSGAAAWYCLVDAVAMGGAPLALGWLERAGDRLSALRGEKSEAVLETAGTGGE